MLDFTKNLGDLLPIGDSNKAKAKLKTKYHTCIAVDANNSKFRFFFVEGEDKTSLKVEEKPYTSRTFGKEFFEEFKVAAKAYADAHPEIAESSVSVVVPDCLVAMDTVNIPSVNRKKMQEALNIRLSVLYKNMEHLKINRFLASQNKQLSVFSVSLMKESVYNAITEACTEAGMKADAITFVANATADALSTLNPKLKSESYFLLDVKSDFTECVFVAKGRATGFFSLPFGYSILQKNRLAAENMLFDHSVAELKVLNSKEKARAKQLTMMGDETPEEGEGTEEENLDAVFGQEEGVSEDPTVLARGTAQTIKTLPKKTPRVLPKFMQRPAPQSDEEYGYENFRLFLKWTLDLLQANDRLFMQGKPEKVYVNMPEKLSYIFDMVNAEEEENGIHFSSLHLKGEKETIVKNLDAFGGLGAFQKNFSNIF